MPDVTRELRPTGILSLKAIRKELASRVRLKVQEGRRWLFFRVLYITGPERAVDEAFEAIDRLEDDAWQAQQW